MANPAFPKLPSPGEAIRGPRRTRPTAVAPEPSVEVAPEIAVEARVAASPPPLPPAAPQAARQAITMRLPRVVTSPDVRVTPDAPVRAADVTLATPARSVRRAMWFALGILLGAVVLSAVHGDAYGVRMWVANAIRSMKRAPAPAVAVTVQAPSHDAAGVEVPCTEEDCALLMAPFKDQKPKVAARVPTVRAEDLPRVRPPVVYLPPPPPPKVEEAPIVAAAASAIAGTATAAPSASAAAPTAAPTTSASGSSSASAPAPASAAPSAAPAVPSGTTSAPAAPSTAPAPAATVESPEKQSVALE